MSSNPPVRTLDDGHLSSLDFEAVQNNLRDRLGGLAGGLNDVQRSQDATPSADTITYPMLFDEAEAADMLASLRSIDLLRLVSQHDQAIVSGLPCVRGPTTLYFSVSAADDAETIHAGAQAYGFRAGLPQEIDLTLRYLSTEAGVVRATYMGTANPFTIYDSGGDGWRKITGIAPLAYGQSYTAPATGILSRISIWMKRDAGMSAGEVFIQLYETDVDGLPIGGPVAVSQSAFSSGISIGGGWVDFLFPAAPAHSVGIKYAFVPEGRGINGDAYWYLDVAGAAYAGGCEVAFDASWTNNTASDYYFKIMMPGEQTTDIVSTPAGFTSWRIFTKRISARFSHAFYSADSLADFYITLPAGAVVNALNISDAITGGQVNWRCGHVRTPVLDSNPLVVAHHHGGPPSSGGQLNPIVALNSGNFAWGMRLVSNGEGGALWVSPGRQLLAEVELFSAAATITFANISAIYSHLEIVGLFRSTRAAESDTVVLTLNADSGNNYDRLAAIFTSVYAAVFTRGGAPPILAGIEAANSTANSFTPVTISLPYYVSSRLKEVQCISGVFGDASADADLAVRLTRMRWRNTAAITRLDLSLSVGPNFAIGTRVQLYGIL